MYFALWFSHMYFCHDIKIDKVFRYVTFIPV